VAPLGLNIPRLKLNVFGSQGPPASATGSPPAAASAGTSAPVEVKSRHVTRGSCAYLNPQPKGRVKIPPKVFDRLRKKSGAAQISAPQLIDNKADLPKPSHWPGPTCRTAVLQEISLDGHIIHVVRPGDAKAGVSMLPTIKQLAEALRVVPKEQRRMTTRILLRLGEEQRLRGRAGSGEVELFPGRAADLAETGSGTGLQNYFDNLVTHECAHNYHGKFWQDKDAAPEWQRFADADKQRPSPYAMPGKDSVGLEDFCEYLVLYNAAVGTACENELKKIYPNRWALFQRYLAR
jgi:hypothetical protein